MGGRWVAHWVDRTGRGRPIPADLDGMLHRGARRHGMKYPHRGLLPQAAMNAIQDAIEIACELRVMMMGRLRRNVLPVVAEVEHQHIVFRQQVLPERKICVDGKSVAVGKQKPHAGGIAVPTHFDFCAVVELDVKAFAGRRKNEMHKPQLSIVG